tara:strand:- start:1109 stop:1900 length:792 start_codon:yes stop_codon:yes gene_type:complete
MSTFYELVRDSGASTTGGFPLEVPMAEVYALLCGPKKNMFVHIHKTAGHTISKELESIFNHVTGKRSYVSKTNHDWCKARPEGHIIFSCIRNPYDLLLSMWFHGPWGQAGIRGSYPSFKDFIMDMHQPGPTQMTYWNRKSARGWDNARWPLRYLQTWQTFQSFKKKRLLSHSFADFYIRFEHLDEVIRYLRGDQETEEVLWLNRSKVRKRRDYRDFYDVEMISVISEFRRQELHMLGYDFDGPMDDYRAIKVTCPFIIPDHSG